MAASTFDFIIVGGGTSGCLLAHRLSHAHSKPSVLLIEAGNKPEGEYLDAHYHRYMPFVLRPDLDYGYESTPQKELNDRVIPYTRGKGLGGSSILNFAVYLYGSCEDYERWAELVGDEGWRWKSVRKSFQKIENYEFGAAERFPHLARPEAGDHGKDGSVKVSLPHTLEEGLAETLEAVVEAGEKINLDLNSGDPMGLGIFPASYSQDGRTTSASAHLVDAPDNLSAWTGSPVRKLLIAEGKVTGVELPDGQQVHSRNDVILCSGAIDTPKLLLLNGIGPAAELEEMKIPVVKDLPGVGKHLQDHAMNFLCCEVDTAHNNRYAFDIDEGLMAEAEAAWKKDKTGNLAVHNSGNWGGFLKLPNVEQWPETKSLDSDIQEYLSREKTPTYEILGNCILYPPDTKLPSGSSYLTAIAFLMNPQSCGSVKLRSADPEDKPVIDLAYLDHAYDRRVLREAVRETWTKVFENPKVKKHVKSRLTGPASLSDEDIDAFLRETTTTVWHANGTTMMGKKDNRLACVDSSFRVFGVPGLRVADLSVCPLTTNNHTQATAYLVGQKAAETLIAEYGLVNIPSAKL